jgi:molybdate transport system substrate-binding protein
MRVTGVWFAMALSATLPAEAADIRVLSGNAVQAPQKAAGELFASKTGHHVTFVFTNPAIIQQKIDAAEPFELYVIPSAFLAAAKAAGKIRAETARPLARVGVGIAARENGPKYDFSTPDAFRKMLLDAKSVAYSDASTGGLSGLSVQKMLRTLGVADAVAAKATTSPRGQEMIASGEVDFGLYNVSEIPRAKGVVLAGAAPAAVQAYLDYDAGVPSMNADPAPAEALAAFLASAEARAFWEKAGIEQVGR